MSEAVETAPEVQARPQLGRLAERVARYDRATSLLIALVMLVAIIVLWLAAALWSSFGRGARAAAVEVKLLDVAEWGDGEEGVSGNEPELGEGLLTAQDPVMADEVTDANVAEDADLAATVVSAVENDEMASFDEPDLRGGSPGIGRRGRPGGTGKKGSGDGGSTVPRALRWVINYTQAQTLESYARLLDYFGIEIGVMRGGERMTYVTGFSKPTPTTRKGSAGEDRLYFTWKDAARRRADAQLLQKAQVLTDNAVLVQFFPAPLEETLAQLEKAFKGKDAKQIRQTRFGVRRAGDGYEFYVIDQTLVN